MAEIVRAGSLGRYTETRYQKIAEAAVDAVERVIDEWFDLNNPDNKKERWYYDALKEYMRKVFL